MDLKKDRSKSCISLLNNTLYQKMLKFWWNDIKKIVRQDFNMLTQLELPLQSRTDRWKRNWKGIDETSLSIARRAYKNIIENRLLNFHFQLSPGYFLFWLYDCMAVQWKDKPVTINFTNSFWFSVCFFNYFCQYYNASFAI